MGKDRFPIRVLNLFTIMDRGGAETMVMNYYRHLDRTKVQFDFMVHRQERGAYDDEIEALGGRIYRMPAIRPWTEYPYRKTVRKFYQEHPSPYPLYRDATQELSRTYRISSIPTLILLDENGYIQKIWPGVPHESSLDKAIREVLK